MHEMSLLMRDVSSLMRDVSSLMRDVSSSMHGAGHDIKLLKPLARGASRFGKLLARLTDKIITYWTTACDIPTISNLNTS